MIILLNSSGYVDACLCMSLIFIRGRVHYRITSLINVSQSIVWKSVVYLLTCYGTGSCDVQTGTNYTQLQRRQIIQHKGYPMDASFFVSANRLYLVVADNSGLFVVPSL